MDHPDFTIAKERGKTESALSAILGRTFGNESVLTVLMPKETVALSAGSINIDQRIVEDVSVEDKNDNSM